MTAFSEIKKCLFCTKPLRGRADKKFCDDACRNSHNNQQKAKSNYSNYVRNINNTLFKNRRILEQILPANEEITRASQEKLVQKGYVFKYHTHTYTNHKGNIYYYCFDYGYLPLQNNRYLIVRRKEG
jgi:predicted nucleic acid-binding Zn ribbon protein